MKYQTKSIYKPILAIVDFIGNIIYNNKSKVLPKNPKKVLFLSLAHIGDLILAMPTFETMKRNNPNCSVHVLCRTEARPLLEGCPYVDEVWVYDAPWLSNTYKPKHYTKDTVKMLRMQNYDIVFEMHGHPKSIWLAHKLQSFIIGYNCRGFGFLLNKIKTFNPHMKTLNQNLYLTQDYWTRMYNQTQLFTPSYNLTLPSSFIIINPSSGKKEKDLTQDEVETIITTHQSDTVLITGLSKDTRFDKFPNVQNWTGKTNLQQLIDMVRKAKTVYCPDTGIMHIAHAVGTPCYACFKTTDPKIWGY